MFDSKLKEQLIKESGNFFRDNDHSPYGKTGINQKILNTLRYACFGKIGIRIFTGISLLYNKVLLQKALGIGENYDHLVAFYNKLSSDESKDLLMKLLAYRILGHVKVKLPLNKSEYFNGLKRYEKLAKSANDRIELPYRPNELWLHDLNSEGFPIKMHLHSLALFTTFGVHHYKKVVSEDKTIKAEKDDIVLDLGGCYGDTALYFANEVGSNGKVYTFEFIPSNKKIFQANLDLNPELKATVEIVSHPVWNESDKEIYYVDKGGASFVGFEKMQNSDGTVTTVTVDDFVKRQGLDKVDFIKTDIEGAEPFALQGCVETLKKFKPKLAISIYHGMNDFTRIIHQIDEMNLGYKFYLGHATLYSSETVLFCEA